MSRRMRVLVSFGIAVVVGGTYLWLFGTQTFFVLEAHNAGRKLPFIKQAPIQPMDLSISQAPGMKLSYFGYEFEIPWTDIDQEKTKIIGENKAIIVFRSGNVISVWSGPPHELMKVLLEETKIDRTTLQQVYGDEALRSDYNFKKLILEITPDKFTIFSSSRTAVSQGMLLLLKAISTPGDPNSGIFEVRTKVFKGFQYGRPQNPPKHVSVELFPTWISFSTRKTMSPQSFRKLTSTA